MYMNKFILILLATLGLFYYRFAVARGSSVALGVLPPEHAFIVGQPIILDAVVSNISGHYVEFNQDWAGPGLSTAIRVHVFNLDMTEVPLSRVGIALYQPSSDLALTMSGAVQWVGPQQSVRVPMDLGQLFNIQRAGNYYVQATLTEQQANPSSLVLFQVNQ